MRKLLLLFFVFLSFGQSIFAQDESVNFRHGRLKNGLTYYIRRTTSSPGRADFYLVQNVGALMEEEEQNGLAHVLEHMAFHATDNFPEGVPTFLKRHGISNFNAYTGHDETVYNVNNVPTASKSLVDSCILILRDWSGFLKLYPEEMEIERQVIQEERRAGMDLATRLQTRANFFIYNGSKYATHDVIGSVEVLQNFTAEQVRNYYKDFYRSDLQAVIILGDINVEEVEAEVKRLFIPISRRENPKPRLVYDIPDSQEPQYYKLIDKDVPTNGMVLMKRFRKNPVNSLRDMLREDLMREFYNKIMRDHLAECMESNDVAFLDASIGIFNIVRDYEGLNMMVSSLPGQEIEALEQLMKQMVRVHQTVITTEKLRAMASGYLKRLEQFKLQKDKFPNNMYLQMYQNNFLLGYPISEFKQNIDTTEAILNSLTAEDFKKWITRWFDEDRNWIYIMQGNNADYPFPTEEQISAVTRSARDWTFESGEEREKLSGDGVLVDFEISAGKIVKEKALKPIGAEEWTLSNGAKVYYKYTDYNEGMFNVLLGSRGGRSLLPAEDLPSADAMVALFLKSGLYKYGTQELNALVQEHSINLDISLEETSESINCTSTTRDADFAFQFLHLVVEKARFDKAAFDKYVYVNKLMLAHSRKTTDDTINDVLRDLRMVKSPRLWVRDVRYYEAMDYEKMVRIFKERYQNASDFSFYVVGDLERETARELVTRYIASLSSTYRKEQPVKYEYYKKESVAKDIALDIPEQKYMVDMAFTNTLKTKPMDKLCMMILQKHFEYLFQQRIRETEGGSYGVHVLTDVTDHPEPSQLFNVQFESSLEKGPRMRAIVHEQIKEFLKEGISDEDVEDLILVLKKERNAASDFGSIPFWTENIQFYQRTGKSLDAPEFFEKVIDKIKAKEVLTFARKFFTEAQCVDIVVKSR